MKSSSGEHYLALDHIRALATFMVFTWHFSHAANGVPVPFEYAPALPPLALLDEGHTGVALFMTLSGYLFARLLSGRDILYGPFFWNRFLRLAPLLLLVVIADGALQVREGASVTGYAWQTVKGVVLPTLPNGGWSITAEVHLYLLLPLLLWLADRSRVSLLAVVLAAIGFRGLVFLVNGEVQYLAYWTAVGRIDQFVLGMFAFHHRELLRGRHAYAALIGLAFSWFYLLFDAAGGIYHIDGYPSASPLWIVLPSIEGMAYAAGIAWYDSSFTPADAGLSRWIARVGTYSYSIYLLHVLFVFKAAQFVHETVMDLSRFPVACMWSLLCFGFMVPIGHLSFEYLERPFLQLRRRYTVARGDR